MSVWKSTRRARKESETLRPFAEDVVRALRESILRMLALKRTRRHLLLCGLARTYSADDGGLLQCKRWEAQPIFVPPQACDPVKMDAPGSTKSPKIKREGGVRGYRPFTQRTKRHRIDPSHIGWKALKKPLVREFAGDRLAISAVYVYLDEADGTPVGVSVYVENLLRRVNIEIIFPAAPCRSERLLHPDAYPALGQDPDWNAVLAATESLVDEEELADVNPMAYLENNVLRGYAEYQRGNAGLALEIYAKAEERVKNLMEGYKSSFAAINLAILQSEARDQYAATQEEIAVQLDSGLPLPTCEILDEDAPDDDVCSICYEHLASVMVLDCQHKSFCPCCAAGWFLPKGNTCPLCRQSASQLDWGAGKLSFE